MTIVTTPCIVHAAIQIFSHYCILKGVYKALFKHLKEKYNHHE